MWSFPHRFGQLKIGVEGQVVSIEVDGGGVLGIRLPEILTTSGIAADFMVEDSQAVQEGSVWRGHILMTSGTLQSTQLKMDLESPVGHAGLRHRFSLTSGSAAGLVVPSELHAVASYDLDGFIGVDEFQTGQFSPIGHSYFGSSRTWASPARAIHLIGPVLCLHKRDGAWVIAHESGVEGSRSSWGYSLPVEWREVTLMAAPEVFVAPRFARDAWKTPWFHAVWSSGSPSEDYSEFVQSLSRFAEVLDRGMTSYNTWHMQESRHYLTGAAYDEALSEPNLQAEMHACGESGVQLFVLDVGWFERTGDWLPNTPNIGKDLAGWADYLSELGMNLGVWLNPIMAGASSVSLAEHHANAMTRSGERLPLAEVWQTEPSAPMCLVSPWADHVRGIVRRLATEGVRNIKLDGLWPDDFTWEDNQTLQACDSADHFHGDESISPALRHESYRYEFTEILVDIASEAAALGVLVDLDVTEPERWPSLGMVVTGRLFLVNNGPYFRDLGIPETISIEPNTYNASFFPSVHHSRVERQATGFLPWLPPSRFLTHALLSDDPLILSNAIGTALVGSNAIWGEIQALAPSTRETVKRALSIREHVRTRVTRTGTVGASPEVYDLIDQAGQSATVAFTFQPVRFEHQKGWGDNPHSPQAADRELRTVTFELVENECVIDPMHEN